MELVSTTSIRANLARPVRSYCAAAHREQRGVALRPQRRPAWRHLDRPKEALEFIAAQPAAIAAVSEVRAWQAFFQAQAAFTDLALTNYARLFAEGYRSDLHFNEYVTLLTLRHQYDAAHAQVAKYLEKEDWIFRPPVGSRHLPLAAGFPQGPQRAQSTA